MDNKTLPASVNQTAIGNDNIQVVGNNNIITRISNFIAGDTEQQRGTRYRRVMLELVKSTWIKGVLEKSLYNEVLITLGMEDRPGAVDHPWDVQVRMPDQNNRTLPTGTSILDVFDEMNGSMLILGVPGSGKTTTLLELAREMLARAERDLSLPIPVVFNLSSWADLNQPLHEWLVNELTNKYYVSNDLAVSWIRNDELFLLLDGLDEVKADQRNDCVQTVNEFRKLHGSTPMVVCSRIQDYEELTRRLNLNGATLLQPLTREQVEEYLERAGPDLTGLRQLVNHESALDELVQQPFFLNIAILAFSGLSVEDIAAGGRVAPDALQKHIFDVYIQRMFSRLARTKNDTFATEKTRKWLAWLGREMIAHGQTSLFIEELQRSWLPSAVQKVLLGITVGLISGMLGVLIFMLVLGPGREALLLGLIIGVGTGLRGKYELPEFEINWSFIKVLQILVVWIRTFVSTGLVCGLIGFVIGIVIGGMSLTLSGLQKGITDGVKIGFSSGLFLGMLGGLTIIFLSNMKTVKEIRSFYWSWKGTVKRLFSFLFFGSLGGVLTGLSLMTYVALTNLLDGPLAKVPNGLPIYAGALVICWFLGVLFCFILWLHIEGFGLFYHYTLRFFLASADLIPWRLVSFLDYCTDRIFLRKVGGGYIFVHRLLMEHFAAMYVGEQK